MTTKFEMIKVGIHWNHPLVTQTNQNQSTDWYTPHTKKFPVNLNWPHWNVVEYVENLINIDHDIFDMIKPRSIKLKHINAIWYLNPIFRLIFTNTSNLQIRIHEEIRDHSTKLIHGINPYFLLAEEINFFTRYWTRSFIHSNFHSLAVV